ncbi:unnamed protein product [Chironomus riparius]|uniref:Thioredoxin domain-containing protein n=1 Tax=Chironomus riparius TaxID=315576 RepID=A0A9N9RTQ4_9DIPT|nr:unnamed protein product [Chironomus riparius]
MRTKTFVWLALCFITALSVGLMVLAILFYDYEQFDKTNDFEDDSVKMIKKSENAFILFYSLEDPNFGFQNSWQSFRMKIQDWNNTNIVYVGKIECSVFRPTCLNFRVDRYPTIAWIKNGKVVEEYVGDDISESIKKFFDKLVTIVTEQKPTTGQKVASSVNIDSSPKILQGGSFDIIRRFIENEKGQNIVSTVSAKTTKATTTVNNENVKNMTETSHTETSTYGFETVKTTENIENSTKASIKSDVKFEDQIEVITTKSISITEKVKESTKSINISSQEPTETTIQIETFKPSLSILNSTTIGYENQTEASTIANHEDSSFESSTSTTDETTIDESSSESIIMTRPTETQSSEQESTKEDVETNKNESNDDESPEDDDPFGLGGLFGNNDGNKAEYEGNSGVDENNDTENEENEDDQKSVETSEVQKFEKSSTTSYQEKDYSSESEENPTTTKSVAKFEESKKKSQPESKYQTELESTTRKHQLIEEKQHEKSTTPTYKSEVKEYKKKSENWRTQRETESTTIKKQYSEEKKKYVKESNIKKIKSESKEHKKHRELSKHKESRP